MFSPNSWPTSNSSPCSPQSSAVSNPQVADQLINGHYFHISIYKNIVPWISIKKKKHIIANIRVSAKLLSILWYHYIKYTVYIIIIYIYIYMTINLHQRVSDIKYIILCHITSYFLINLEQIIPKTLFPPKKKAASWSPQRRHSTAPEGFAATDHFGRQDHLVLHFSAPTKRPLWVLTVLLSIFDMIWYAEFFDLVEHFIFFGYDLIKFGQCWRRMLLLWSLKMNMSCIMSTNI